jgi:hypothetical protein
MSRFAQWNLCKPDHAGRFLMQGSGVIARTESITMSMREIDRLKVIQAVIDGNLKGCAARLHAPPGDIRLVPDAQA